VHLVTRGHFRSRDKDGGHTVRSAVSENPHAVGKLCGSVLCRTEVAVTASKLLSYFVPCYA